MIDKDKHDIDDGGFIVPIKQQQVKEERSEDLFENLKKITPEEISKAGDEIYYSGMVKKLEEGYEGEPLDLGFAVYLLNHKKDKLLVNNFGKFDETKHREIIFKYIEFLGKKDSIYSDDKARLISICKKVDKEMAILLINNGLSTVMTHKDDRWRISAEGLDMEIVNKLKEKDYSLTYLKLDEFIEKDRKDIALEIIKARGEPNLSSIPKECFTQEFALSIINIGREDTYKFLSKNIKLFDETIQKELVLKYIKGGYWKYIDSNRTNLIYGKETAVALIALIDKGINFDITKFTGLDVDIVNELKEKGYDFLFRELKLDEFIAKDRKNVALEIIKVGGEPNLSLIPKEYLTQDFALDIVNIGTEHAYTFLAENIELFEEATQKVLALKYIEHGHWDYVDAMWPDTIRGKDIVISLIDNDKEEELTYYMNFGFKGLDMDVVNKLKEKGYDLKNLSKGLGCFREEDRKEIALEIIKAGGEPNLSLIPKEHFKKDFAQEIINLKLDNGFKVLSENIRFFDELSTQDIILNFIKAGGLKYIKNEILKTKRFDEYLDKNLMLTIIQNNNIEEAVDLLKKFSGLDSEIALSFIKAGKGGALAKNLESFSNLNNEVATALIGEGYKYEVKSNIERFNIRMLTRLRLLRKGKEITKDDTGDKLPEELIEFRNQWKEKKELVIEDIKDKIIKAADKIHCKVKIERDGSKLFTLRLRNRTLQILIPQLNEENTDEKYRDEEIFDYEYRSKFDFNNKLNKFLVELGGMHGCVDKWKNIKLRKFVKSKQKQGFHMPNMDEMLGILSELGETGGLDIEEEKKDIVTHIGGIPVPLLTTFQGLLLMYITGCPGSYWLSEGNGEAPEDQEFRMLIHLSMFYACFEKHEYDFAGFPAGILMIK